jgi:hypothetical protein
MCWRTDSQLKPVLNCHITLPGSKRNFEPSKKLVNTSRTTLGQRIAVYYSAGVGFQYITTERGYRFYEEQDPWSRVPRSGRRYNGARY